MVPHPPEETGTEAGCMLQTQACFYHRFPIVASRTQAFLPSSEGHLMGRDWDIPEVEKGAVGTEGPCQRCHTRVTDGVALQAAGRGWHPWPGCTAQHHRHWFNRVGGPWGQVLPHCLSPFPPLFGSNRLSRGEWGWLYNPLRKCSAECPPRDCPALHCKTKSLCSL